MHRSHRHHHHSDSDGDTQQNEAGNATGANAASNTNSGVPDFTMAAMLAAYRAFGTNGLAGATNTLSVVE